MKLMTWGAQDRLAIGAAMTACLVLSGAISVVSARGEREPMYVEAARQLDEARERLASALAHAELSLTRREDQSSWTREHMRRAREILRGSGPSVARLLEETRDKIDGRAAFPMAGSAIDHALDYLHLATIHVNQSLRARTDTAVVEHAREAAGLISATIGRSESAAPATGALSYAIAVVNIWTLPVVAMDHHQATR